jgi:hypothetical protein
MEKPRPYLPEAAFDDYKEAIREVTFEELPGRVKNLEELKSLLEQRDAEAEALVGQQFEFDSSDREQKEEVAILERIPNPGPHQDFYMARRQRPGTVFEPETVIVAKNRAKTYLVRYAGDDAESFEAVDEQRFLKDFVNPTVMKADTQGNIPVAESEIVMAIDESRSEMDSGGMGQIYPVLLRRQSKLLPEAGVRKESFYDFGPGEDLETNLIIKDFLERDAGQPGADYFVRPLGDVEINDRQNILYEMAEADDKVAANLFKEIKTDKLGLTPEQRLTIIRQLFTGLKYLNERGLRHNDIKPANILLAEHGIKICDYGLTTFRQADVAPEQARRASELPEDTNTERFDKIGVILGTIPYVTPQLINRFSKDNTDTFGAAVTAISLITKKDPRVFIPKGGDNPTMAYLTRFEEFKDNIAIALEQTLQSEEYAGYDQEKLAALGKLIKEGLDLPPDGDPPSAAEYVAALQALGVPERLNRKATGAAASTDLPEDAPTIQMDPEAAAKPAGPEIGGSDDTQLMP